jgi:hypothetical protein
MTIKLGALTLIHFQLFKPTDNVLIESLVSSPNDLVSSPNFFRYENSFIYIYGLSNKFQNFPQAQ